jgi:lysophospholipase L1-like esterase
VRASLLPLLFSCASPPSASTDSAASSTSDSAGPLDSSGDGGDTPADGGGAADGGSDTNTSADSGGTTGDGGGDTGDPLPKTNPTAAECFAEQGLNVDYDLYGPLVGTHCKGTDHQDIVGVEHVVFVGDSITVGTPPTDASDWYRNVLADALGDRFGLETPGWSWQNVDLFNGVTYDQDDGAFSSCAKWGARTDDLTGDPHQQMQTCIPEDVRDQATLVVATIGGNDLFSWAQDLVDGADDKTLWAAAAQAVDDMETSVHWLVDDPTMFPNGVYLVFANTFEFTDTDSGNDLATCTGADWIGMDTALIDPRFTSIAAWMMEEYMRIAVETGTDMVFFGESACGHGYTYQDSDSRCYRGADAELWLDLTCMHPSAAGHAGLADLFLAVVDE